MTKQKGGGGAWDNVDSASQEFARIWELYVTVVLESDCSRSVSMAQHREQLSYRY